MKYENTIIIDCGHIEHFHEKQFLTLSCKDFTFAWHEEEMQMINDDKRLLGNPHWRDYNKLPKKKVGTQKL